MPADPALVAALADAGTRIRDHLRDSGKWAEEQAVQTLGEACLPDVLSTHLCRETNLFGRAILEAAGFTGWTLVDGTVDLEGARGVPAEIVELVGPPESTAPRAVPHSWLVHEELGLVLDLSADQFGPDLHDGNGVLVAEIGDVVRLARGTSGDWFDEESDIPATLQLWLNLPERATAADLPVTRRTDPVAEMLRQFVPADEEFEPDRVGEVLRVLIDEVAAIGTSLDQDSAPDGP